jgi:hypothetical protein
MVTKVRAKGKQMMVRNIDSRIAKLEASRKHRDETLVVWRLPGTDASEAVAGASHGPGDRVIYLEWYGEGPLPQPKWHRSVSRGLSKEEDASVEIMVTRMLDASPEDMRRAHEGRRGPDPDLRGYSDDELLHALFGVVT